MVDLEDHAWLFLSRLKYSSAEENDEHIYSERRRNGDLNL